MDMPTKTMKIAVLGYPVVFCAFCYLLVILSDYIVSLTTFSPAIMNLGLHLAILMFGYLGLRLYFKNRNKQFYGYLISVLLLGVLFSLPYTHTLILANG